MGREEFGVVMYRPRLDTIPFLICYYSLESSYEGKKDAALDMTPSLLRLQCASRSQFFVLFLQVIP
jgi:hypothetical protein